MGDGKVRGKNRHGIAENQVFVPVKDSFLIFGKMIRAEETVPPVPFCSAHLRRTAPDSSGVVLEADRKSMTRQVPFPDLFEGLIAFPQVFPGPFLLGQEFETES